MHNISESGQAGADHAGKRVDQVAAVLFSDYSRARLQAWISEGALTVDGRAVKPSHTLTGGEWLQLDATAEAVGHDEPEDLPVRVVFEDEHLIVVNKPPGLVVHPAAGRPSGTLLNRLLHHDPKLAALPRAGIVHRLDKDTSGVMVVARSLKAHAFLVEQLQSRAVRRLYEALVTGVPDSPGTIDAPLARRPRDRKRIGVVAGGKEARTRFRLIESFGFASHMELSLETGRTHQIRVHMQHIGHALLGDPQYGPGRGIMKALPAEVCEAAAALGRQALHARKLELNHPETGQACHFEAPLPGDFLALRSVLEEQARECT
ncbi:MAG: RluA family pseudouridine synthase [Xanthomonadales bacterium]|nr:RluA family pseudouridine synthase [Xanthomonadales bacterium]